MPPKVKPKASKESIRDSGSNRDKNSESDSDSDSDRSLPRLSVGPSTLPLPMAIPKIKLQKFDGSEKSVTVDAWFRLFEIVVQDVPTAKDKIEQLISYLQGDALEYFALVIAPKINELTYEQAKDKFVFRFSPDCVSPLISAQRMHQQKGTPVRKYFDQKLALLQKTSLKEYEIVESLTDGLLPEYRQFLPSARCKTLDAWVEIVSNLEADPAIKARYGHGQLSSIGVPTTNCIIQHCKGCGSGESSSVQKHLMRQGKEKGSDRPSEPCRFCTAAGKRFFHWHKDCWRKKLDEQKVEKSQINNVIMNFNSRAFASFAKIPVQVNSFQTQAILDSGSTVNVVNEDFVRMAKVPVDCRDSTITMAGGTSACISGVASFPLTIENHTQIVEALVMPHFSYFMLLGINIGKFFPVIVDFEQHLAYVKPKEEVQGHSDIHQEVQPELNFLLPIHEARAEVDQLCQKYTDVFDVNNKYSFR